MARDAYIFLIPLFALLLLCFWTEYIGVAVVLLVLCVFVAFFFRDPERSIPEDPRVIVSPADGKVIRLDREGEGSKLSIFLSLFDVHINRAPIAGTLIQRDH
ncbi:phosphatidylserine decarboxylase, partial [bacterium]|nr:phosphatidylserine decarboxylase [bacterium]